MQEGESPESVYVIVEGWAASYRTLEDGRRQIMSVLVPGDCHIGTLAEGLSRYSICAITSCVVDIFPRAANPPGDRMQSGAAPDVLVGTAD